MRKSNYSICMVAIAVAIAGSVAALAQTPVGNAFTYQGQLKDAGAPYSGPADLEFRLYTAAVGGSLIGTDVITGVPVGDGVFSVELDFGLDAFNGDARWLEVRVNGTTLTPRQNVTPAPYALHALSGGESLWEQTRGDIYYTDGYVGIGTTNPNSVLHVNGDGTDPSLRVQVSGNSKLTVASNGGVSVGGYQNNPPADGLYVAGNVGLGSSAPGAHRLYVRSSGGGASGSTVHIENDNTTNGIALSIDNDSADVTMLISAHDVGDLIRCDSYVGGWHPVFKVANEGEVTCSVLTITGGSDLCEQFDINAAAAAAEPGTVVCIDPENPGELVVSGKAYDRAVAGVISGAGGVKPGMLMGQNGSVADGEHPVALTGRVYVRCDTSNGPIQPGDLLTTSATPGHAMRVSDHSKAQGAIIGKAMTSLDSGDGLVLVLISLQ